MPPIKSQKIGGGRGKGATYGNKKAGKTKRDRAVTAEEPFEELQDDDQAEDTEYEIEDIIDHSRDGKFLEYHVTWVGYPGENTWVPEKDMNADEVLEKYWKNVDPKKQHERYKPGSAQAKAAQAKAKTPKKSAPTSKVSSQAGSSQKRRGTQIDEDEDEDELPARASSSKRKSTGGKSDTTEKTSRDKSPPKSKRARASEVAEESSKKRARARVPDTESVDELSIERGDAPDDGEASEIAASEVLTANEENGVNGDGEEGDEDEDAAPLDGYVEDRPESDNDKKYATAASWEEYVDYLDTVEIKAPEGVVLSDDDDGKQYLYVRVIWTDGTATWVHHDRVRKKCPQKVIDFYMVHLRFKQAVSSSQEAE